MYITLMENSQEFVLRLLADFGLHAVAPDVGNILVRQQPFFGSRIGESMRDGAGDFQAGDYSGRNLHFGIREHAMGRSSTAWRDGEVRAFGSGFLDLQ